jgi:hypothetical protein
MSVSIMHNSGSAPIGGDGDACSPPRRAAFYVDGFNFYHALDELNLPHLKWLDWAALAKLIATPAGERVERIVLCTAKPKHRPEDVQDRHQTYMDALRARGIIVREGWFLAEQMECRDPRCRANPGTWQRHTEKEGDVSLALSLIEDAYEDRFDTAYLVTSDNDQVPTLDLLRRRFGPASAKPKKAVVVFPTWRRTGASTKLANLAATARLSEAMVGTCLLPRDVLWYPKPGVLRRIQRPARYEPPPAARGQG